MSVLALVRHGQARFGTADYDALSPLGVRQCELLRDYWRARGETFDEVWAGTMQRQLHTAQLACGKAPQHDARWNEYDADGILRHLAPALAESSPAFAAVWQAHVAAPTDRRLFQQMFEPLMQAWLAAEREHPDVESWASVRARVSAALRDVMRSPASRRVAVFTSGGPIGVATMLALGAPDGKALELNWRLRNSSVTSFLFSGARFSLDAFNHTPHLEAEAESFR